MRRRKCVLTRTCPAIFRGSLLVNSRHPDPQRMLGRYRVAGHDTTSGDSGDSGACSQKLVLELRNVGPIPMVAVRLCCAIEECETIRMISSYRLPRIEDSTRMVSPYLFGDALGPICAGNPAWPRRRPMVSGEGLFWHPKKRGDIAK